MEKVKDEEEPSRLKVHPSGLQYYDIKLVGDQGTEIDLRLFESFSAARLKWEDDEETHDEYKVRRKYIKQSEKGKKGQVVWQSEAWGAIDEVNALRVHGAINEGKDLNTIGKLK